MPKFQNFQTAAVALKASADAFMLSPDAAKLDSLKEDYYNAYRAFQAVEVYTFTPSMDLITALNSFPPDTVQINANIQSGTYNLSAVNNIRAKGFPAIDFLLFGKNESETVSAFAQANRQQYLSDIVQEIFSKASSASSGWGSFESDFVNASGTDVGSSVGMLVNDLSFDMERNRRERVGNALGYIGTVSGGTLVPDAVEAYYSGYSKELLIENLQQLKLLYEGGSGQGFDDYLSRLGADYYGTPLATEISNQFDKAIQAAQNVPVTFSVAVTANNAEMQALFLELKKLTVMIKVDMSSQLGVVINYSDNDGD
jgi:predicted lipoprotein